MWFSVITLFPELFDVIRLGVTGRAIDQKLVQLHFINPRDYADDKRRTIDHYPFGGSVGMIMLVEPMLKAIAVAQAMAPKPAKVIYLSPQGRIFSHHKAVAVQKNSQPLIFVTGRYEGLDQRIIDIAVDEEWSIGDYVLSGGELAALVVLDAIIRQIPGALNKTASYLEDTHSQGLLKYPQYSKPVTYEGLTVPAVLMSGNHAEIKKWQLKQSLGVTWTKRPDLLAKYQLSAIEQSLLDDYIAERKEK